MVTKAEVIARLQAKTRPRMPEEAPPTPEWNEDLESQNSEAPDFSRMPCSACKAKNSVASFKVADSRICLRPCFEAVKRASGLSLEGIEALTLAKVKEYLDIKVE